MFAAVLVNLIEAQRPAVGYRKTVLLDFKDVAAIFAVQGVRRRYVSAVLMERSAFAAVTVAVLVVISSPGFRQLALRRGQPQPVCEPCEGAPWECEVAAFARIERWHLAVGASCVLFVGLLLDLSCAAAFAFPHRTLVMAAALFADRRSGTKLLVTFLGDPGYVHEHVVLWPCIGGGSPG